VTEVIDDSPAEKAGIEDGDIIVEFEGKKVESADELRKLISEESVGDKVSVKLVRDNESKAFDVTLGDWADQPTMVWYGGPGDDFAAPYRHHLEGFAHAMVWPHRLGVRVSELNEDLGSYFGVKGGEGVLVLDIEENSTGEAVGIKGGDVIVKVEGEAVKSTEQLRDALSDVEPGDDVTVTVVRNKKTIDLKGEMKEAEGAAFGAPAMRMFHRGAPNDDLRRELDQLRKEIDELKKELKKS
jgi:serine protease Do